MSNETDKEALKYGEDFFIEKLGVEEEITIDNVMFDGMPELVKEDSIQTQEVTSAGDHNR